ncbi:OmpA family protein [Tamlana crocina]
MIKNITFFIMAVAAIQLGVAQKTRADRFFEKGDYINAAKYYEDEIKKVPNKHQLEQLSISYYNTFQYREALRYLKLLTKGRFPEKDKTYANHFNFKLYHLLSALGDYETGLSYLELHYKNLGNTLNIEEAIKEVEDFKLKTPDYTVKKVHFNSEASDFGAIKLGDSIYFTSDRNTNKIFEKTYKWTHQPFLDIYAVRVDDKNVALSEVRPLNENINSKFHEGNFCFTSDGNTMYISRSNLVEGKKQFNDEGSNNIHIYKSTKENGVWSKPEKLFFNENGYSYQHPALSPDGKRLYFSSNRPGGFGSFDIYYVEIKGEHLGDPVNLGATINTKNREHFPFISSEGHLFFASNGHLGLGMLDNFVSEFVENDFTKPINLGVPINSRYDDFNLNYYSETEGFFSSNRNRRSDDIFQFIQKGEIFIREYINTFEIRDVATKAFVANANVELLDKHGKQLYTNSLDTLATFNKNLLAGHYILKATAEGYYSKQENLQVIEAQDQKHVLYLKQEPPVIVNPVEAIIAEKQIDEQMEKEDPKRFALLTDADGPPVIEKDGKLFFQLEPIYFDFDMWNIRADSKKILDELAAKLERYPDVHLKISAHTDSRGTVRYNQLLSERRAESTRNYLALEGFINARRIKFEGFGELEPIVPCPMLNCTDEEHQLNRRSEFEIIEY